MIIMMIIIALGMIKNGTDKHAKLIISCFMTEPEGAYSYFDITNYFAGNYFPRTSQAMEISW